MWIDSKVGQTTGPVDIQWISDELKLLGITFGSHSTIYSSWWEKISQCFNA